MEYILVYGAGVENVSMDLKTGLTVLCEINQTELHPS